jgi:Ca2+-binding EF-hand superfamily protein
VPGVCAGDCDGNGTVSISELVRGVSIALGQAALDRCTRVDANGDGVVSVAELIRAVGHALNGCP